MKFAYSGRQHPTVCRLAVSHRLVLLVSGWVHSCSRSCSETPALRMKFVEDLVLAMDGYDVVCASQVQSFMIMTWFAF